MKKFLYGNKIEKACIYCTFGRFNREENSVFCKKKNRVKETADKCLRFKYDPILRKPKQAPLIVSVKEQELTLNI